MNEDRFNLELRAPKLLAGIIVGSGGFWNSNETVVVPNDEAKEWSGY